MDSIIKVENLSKKYLIGHELNRGGKTFREAIVQTALSFGSKFSHPFSKTISASSPLEEFWALKDINFEVQKGERLGIIGRNGAGKSTLLKVLSRITEPTSGKINIRGRIASLLEVGTGFSGELTGRENIYLNGAILGMPKSEIRQKFDEIVEFSGVEKFLDTPVKRYSSGMYVRLAFAVAAHLEPEILIVDEVLAVGDAEFQQKCLGKMSEVSLKEGRTVIFVSHNLVAIRNLCNKSIFLEKGKIVENGEVNHIVDIYLKQVNTKISKSIETSFCTLNRVIINSDDNSLIKTFDDIEILANLKAKTDIADFGIYIGILGESGNRIFGTDLRDFIRVHSIKKNESFRAGFRFMQTPILPGKYYVEIHLKDMSNRKIELIEKAAFFEVVQIPIYGNRVLDEWFGHILVKAEPIFKRGVNEL